MTKSDQTELATSRIGSVTDPSTGTPRPSGSRLSRRALMAVPSLAGALGAAGVLRNRYQNRMVFLPDRYPNGIWNPGDFGLPAEDVWFQAGDGVELHGWWIPHKKARGTVLFFHGNAGSLGHRVGVLTHLHKLKANFLAIDYRGYGRSKGSATEEGVYRDALAAYEFLTGEKGLSPGEIILFGHSLGGAVAIECASQCVCAGLVVQSSLTDTREAAKALYPTYPLHWFVRRQFRSIDKVAGLTMPKLFVHGEADGTLPIRLGKRLYEAAAEPKEFLPIPNAGHNDLYRHGGLKYMRRLGRFRDSCLKAATQW